MKIGKRLRTGAKALAALVAGLLLFGAAACSHDSGGSNGSDGGDGDVAVTGVTVAPEKATLYVTGDKTTETLTATVTPSDATDKSVSWQPAPSSRAELSATTGDSITVTAKAAGSVTIKATAGGKDGFATIIVYADAASEAKFQEVKGTYTAGEKSVTIREDGIVIIDGEESEDPAVVNDDGSLTVGGHTITVTNDALTLDNTTYEKVAILLTGPSGSTKHNTIKGALAAIPTTGSDTYTITLQPSTYNENGLSYSGSATIVIEGSTDKEYGADVIIAGKGSSQTDSRTRCLLLIDGSANLVLKNVTLESTLRRKSPEPDYPFVDKNGKESTQSEVLGFNSSGTVIAYNSSFKSRQDTIRTVGKAWFYKCYIEGDVDFLWMEETGIVALYEDCEIKMVGDDTNNAYIAAPRMAETKKPAKGLVVYNSNITVGDGLTKATLARTPWNEDYYNQVAYINNTIDGTLTNTWEGSSIATRFLKTDIG